MTSPFRIAIVCATAEERAAIAGVLQHVSTAPDPYGAYDWTFAQRGNLLITLAQSSIGKANVAALTARTIERYHPDFLIFCGIAGALSSSLKPGDFLVAQQTATYDYGAITKGTLNWYLPGTLPIGERPEFQYRHTLQNHGAVFDTITELQPKVKHLITTGRILSGDAFMNCSTTRDALHAAWSADAIDMESDSFAQIAHRHKLHALVLRTISDQAGEESHLSYEDLVHATAQNSAQFLDAYLNNLAADDCSQQVLRTPHIPKFTTVV